MNKAKVVCSVCGHDEYVITNIKIYERKSTAFLEFIRNGWDTFIKTRCLKCGNDKFITKVIE